MSNMRQRVTRLKQLLLIKEKAVEQAIYDLYSCRQQFEAAKQQHDQLVNYRQDYELQLKRMGSQGCSINQWHNHINFINQLDIALKQGAQKLTQLALKRKDYEIIFQNKKKEQDAVIRLIERVELQQKAAANRLEQKENDELAQKKWYRKR